MDGGAITAPRTRRSAIRTHRGFSGIGLVHPKNPHNVGSVLRAAGCFGASFVAVTGRRYQRACTDTMHAYRHIPLFQVEDLRAAIPFDCVPVAIEFCEGAQTLPQYKHPDRAFYIFGPEDGSIGGSVLEWCRDRVRIPSGCLNLAAAVNVVLYDREAKRPR
jgi:tRNA(Leu) C34 or U34 (ribose-2'-O)-methylase TrmL